MKESETATRRPWRWGAAALGVVLVALLAISWPENSLDRAAAVYHAPLPLDIRPNSIIPIGKIQRRFRSYGWRAWGIAREALHLESAVDLITELKPKDSVKPKSDPKPESPAKP